MSNGIQELFEHLKCFGKSDKYNKNRVLLDKIYTEIYRDNEHDHAS